MPLDIAFYHQRRGEIIYSVASKTDDTFHPLRSMRARFELDGELINQPISCFP